MFITAIKGDRRALALQAASDDQHTVSVHCIRKQEPVPACCEAVLSSRSWQAPKKCRLGGKGPRLSREPKQFLSKYLVLETP